ncbi:hypothetical protein JK386_04605 [Nocardioides sp. zg-536]|uniref:LPXTG cell wall anchor domain-containing protein n=1 Tax=Nocardioides faecalis TaxID=2803858 RepID=A0A938Y4Q8_9ACTN|nr:hypothetical protein [Nocardioides faecalis]MBM9459172.1 hypothetical protein [Nocardioides faecalis]QVI60778.1 hypothetical protein KG111_04910 [Nocardioides faecalis]
MRAAFRRGFGGALVAGAAALAVAPLPMLTAPASAAPTKVTMEIDCTLPVFNRDFDWTAEVTASAVTDGTNTSLSLAFSDMPGVAPVPVNKQNISGTLVADVDGKSVTMKGTRNVTAASNAPVGAPTVTASIPGSTDPIDVSILTFDMVVAGIEIKCKPETSGAVGAVAVETGTLPTASPTPTVTPTPTPTPTPTKPESTPTKAQGAKKGVPAKGKASFDCKLMTLGSPFKYNPTVTVSGARAKEGDSKVSISAKFSEIPGLAPVPIENGTMKITAAAKIDGKNVSFSHSSTVNAPTYGTVAVPTLTSTVETDNDQVPVEITAFKFDFGEMSGLTVYSDCKGGGKLSRMTVGVGEKAVNEVGDDVAGGGSAGGGTPAAGGSSLPGTGAGAPLAAIGLWAGALALFGAAVFLLVPRSRIQA